MLLLLKDIIFQILRALGRYYFLYVEFSDFYVNQSLAGQTIHMFNSMHVNKIVKLLLGIQVLFF
jgi:hypothetical protein